MFTGNRPTRLGALRDRGWALAGKAGLRRSRLVTLEVRGRRSGRVRSLPLVAVGFRGERYLVALLGERAQWVANVRAAGGWAILRDGPSEAVRLEEVVPSDRAPILRRYLEVAPGARAFIAVDRRAPLEQFERVAGRYPVFYVRGDAPPQAPRRSPRPYYTRVFALSVPFWILGFFGEIPGLGFELPISALMAVVPAAAALTLVRRHESRQAARRLARRVLDVRKIASPWYVPILATMPLLHLASYWLMRLVGVALPEPQIRWGAIGVYIAVFLVAAAGEELGWTGYATDPLLARYSALRASVELGLVWGLWHVLPYAQAGHGAAWIASQLAFTIAARVLIVWLYVNTLSLGAVTIFHASINASVALFPNAGSHYSPIVTGILTIMLAIAVVRRWGTQTLARNRAAATIAA